MKFKAPIAASTLCLLLMGCNGDKPASSGEGKPDEAKALLTSALNRYAAMKSFEAVEESGISLSGKTPVSTKHILSVELPNRFAMRFPEEVGLGTPKPMPAAYFISDGKKLLEGAGTRAFESMSPPHVSLAPDAMILSQSWTHNSLFLRLFGGPEALSVLAKSDPMIDRKEVVDGHKTTVVKFSAEGMYGTTELSIDDESHLVRRVHCKMEPVAEQLSKSLPDLKSIDYVSTIKEEKIDGKLDAARFVPTAPKDALLVTGITPKAWIHEGMEAPDFTLTRPSGETVKISSLRGKVVYVDFWATWCGPCKATLPQTQAIFNNHKDIEVFAVTDEKQDVALKFIKENKYTFPVAFDQKRDSFARYGIAEIPTFLVIDKAGKIAGIVRGGNEDAVKAALAKAGVQS